MGSGPVCVIHCDGITDKKKKTGVEPMEKLRGERVMYRYKVVQVWAVLLRLDGLSVVLKTGKCPIP